MTAEVKPTNCHYCGYCCAFLATVEDGRVTDLAPDPSRYPYDERILAGCRRWRMNLDALDGADRVNYPLRRAGERGGNEWERVGWDEALDDIAARLQALADEHGPETLASAIGGPHASFWPLHRFMNLFGSPNNMGIGQICWNPRIWMDALTFGWTVEADIVPGVTECLFIWGTNPAQSDNSAFWRSILAFARSDAPLVVVDPRRTQAAAVADPLAARAAGHHCTLALGLLHVIIEEGLADRAFVDAWCHGFDELAAHVRPYTPAHVAAVCGLPEDDIVRAARLFGRAGAAALVSGRGVDQVGANVAPTHRAICCLRAVTGNVDKPGSCVLAEGPDFVSEMELEMSDALAPERRARCLNTPFTPLQCYEGYDRARKLTEKLGRTLPERYLTSALPHLVLRAMEEGEAVPGARAHRERHEPAAHLCRHAPRVRCAHGPGLAGGAGLLYDAHGDDRRLRAAGGRCHRAPRAAGARRRGEHGLRRPRRRGAVLRAKVRLRRVPRPWPAPGPGGRVAGGDAGRRVRGAARARGHGLGRVLPVGHLLAAAPRTPSTICRAPTASRRASPPPRAR